MKKDLREYYGIGRVLLAYGIKLSIDNGLRGVIIFEAKTEELARHYEEDFHAIRVFALSSTKRYMLCDDEAKEIFLPFLEEEE